MTEEFSDTIQFDHTNAPRIFKQGQYVVLRIEMTAADDIAAKNSTAKMAPIKQGQKQPEITMTLGDAQLAVMRSMIVGWGGISRKVAGPDQRIHETPLPYSAENVRLLPKRIWDFVYNKINELNPDPDEEEVESFLPGSNGHTGESSEKVRVLHPSS